MQPRKLTKQEQALFRAIERRDLKTIRQSLSNGVGPNVADWSTYVGNQTALMYAAGCQFPEAVKVLLEAGADPNASTVAGAGSNGGATALHKAIGGSDAADTWNPNARLQFEPYAPTIAREVPVKILGAETASRLRTLLDAKLSSPTSD